MYIKYTKSNYLLYYLINKTNLYLDSILLLAFIKMGICINIPNLVTNLKLFLLSVYFLDFQFSYMHTAYIHSD